MELEVGSAEFAAEVIKVRQEISELYQGGNQDGEQFSEALSEKVSVVNTFTGGKYDELQLLGFLKIYGCDVSEVLGAVFEKNGSPKPDTCSPPPAPVLPVLDNVRGLRQKKAGGGGRKRKRSVMDSDSSASALDAAATSKTKRAKPNGGRKSSISRMDDSALMDLEGVFESDEKISESPPSRRRKRRGGSKTSSSSSVRGRGSSRRRPSRRSAAKAKSPSQSVEKICNACWDSDDDEDDDDDNGNGEEVRAKRREERAKVSLPCCPEVVYHRNCLAEQMTRSKQKKCLLCGVKCSMEDAVVCNSMDEKAPDSTALDEDADEWRPEESSSMAAANGNNDDDDYLIDEEDDDSFEQDSDFEGLVPERATVELTESLSAISAMARRTNAAAQNAAAKERKRKQRRASASGSRPSTAISGSTKPSLLSAVIDFGEDETVPEYKTMPLVADSAEVSASMSAMEIGGRNASVSPSSLSVSSVSTSAATERMSMASASTSSSSLMAAMHVDSASSSVLPPAMGRVMPESMFSVSKVSLIKAENNFPKEFASHFLGTCQFELLSNNSNLKTRLGSIKDIHDLIADCEVRLIVGDKVLFDDSDEYRELCAVLAQLRKANPRAHLKVFHEVVKGSTFKDWKRSKGIADKRKTFNFKDAIIAVPKAGGGAVVDGSAVVSSAMSSSAMDVDSADSSNADGSDTMNMFDKDVMCQMFQELMLQSLGDELMNVYTVNLRVHVSRSLEKEGTYDTSSDGMNLNGLLQYLFPANRALTRMTKSATDVVQTYRKKGHIATLESLLDFACRHATDDEPLCAEIPPDSDYGCKLKLQPYQIQTVHWMFRREKSAFGALDDLYVKEKVAGAGSKHSEFLYSPVLGKFSFANLKPVRGGLICEEMGLGKTIEAICLIQLNKRKAAECGKKIQVQKGLESKEYTQVKTTLIVTAPSLIGQWADEIDKHCAEGRPLKYYMYHGQSRKRDIKFLSKFDAVLTTYGIIGSYTENPLSTRVSKAKTKKVRLKPLHSMQWWRIVVDEGHKLKQGSGVESKALLYLESPQRWILTGTPFCNSVTDIHNQFKFVGFDMYKKRWFDDRNKEFQAANLSPCAPLLSLTRQLIMRHKKAQSYNGRDIVSLPPKHEYLIEVEFETDEQKEGYRKMYEAARKHFEWAQKLNRLGKYHLALMQGLIPVRRVCSGFVASRTDIEERWNAAEARLQSIAGLTVVKKAAGDGLAADDPKRLQKYAETDEEAFNETEDNECSICFEVIEHMLMTPCKHAFCAGCISDWIAENHNCPLCRAPIDTEENLKLRVEKKSAAAKDDVDEKKLVPEIALSDRISFDCKLKVLIKELMKLRAEKPCEKVLIFTMFQETQQWLTRELSRRGFTYRELKGSMTVKKRQKALAEFQSDPPTTVFVLTIRTGAVGITLTSANHVFLMEPCLNDALARQAANRVYRLGQKKPVHIKTFVMKGTIEEKIVQMHRDARSESGRAGNLNRDKATCHQLTKLFAD